MSNSNNQRPVAEDLDVLIVGAGFAGLYQLHHHRKLGHSCRVFEGGADLGGVWFWNKYPGARVDSYVPLYQYSMPETWRDWTWKERYPGWEELRDYFHHVESKLDLKKDISFNTWVIGARWDDSIHRWQVKTDTGITVNARFLVLATGFAAKNYIPQFKDMESYQGIIHHTSKWPQEGIDLKNKRVAVIGTGASGVQVIQEVGPIVQHLTVFQRTPNMCLPMRQQKLDAASQEEMKKLYPVIYRRRLQSYGGFIHERYPLQYFSTTPEYRLLRLEENWQQGGLEIFSRSFSDVATNQQVNDEVYAFWREKVRARLRDPEMQEKLAPTTAPHPIGSKRLALEQTYFEVYNQENVDLISVHDNPIAEFTPRGIKTADGVEHVVDVAVLATGFDAITGPITQIDIRGVDGTSILEKWKNGVYTNLGMATHNFPNMFFIYSVQGPTAFCNAPTCVEIQGDWVIDCIKYMNRNGFTSIETTRQAEEDWRNMVFSAYEGTLLTKARGWWNGGNIPGKVVEPLNYSGGVFAYSNICKEKADKGYEGFTLSSLPAKKGQAKL